MDNDAACWLSHATQKHACITAQVMRMDQRHNVNADMGLSICIYVYIPLKQIQPCISHVLSTRLQTSSKPTIFLKSITSAQANHTADSQSRGRDQKPLHQVNFRIGCWCIIAWDSAAAFAQWGVLTVLYLEWVGMPPDARNRKPKCVSNMLLRVFTCSTAASADNCCWSKRPKEGDMTVQCLLLQYWCWSGWWKHRIDSGKGQTLTVCLTSV